MPHDTVKHLQDQLDEAKRRFGPGDDKRVEGLLVRLASIKFADTEALIHFHESLLFLRAYPPSPRVLNIVESELSSFSERVELLETTGADSSAFLHPDISGIAHTSVVDTFSYNIVRWLLKLHPAQVKFDWEWFEDDYRLAATWPRFMPLLEEDASVEANVPYLEWLRAAAGSGKDQLKWMIERFASLAVTDKERSELYDSLKLYVRWTPSYKASRTGMKLPVREIYYHREPLIQRRDISLRKELESPPQRLKRLSTREGQAILDLTRETSTVRYRELYGFTHGDAKRVFQTSIGRGVELFVIGVSPGLRLPLRAYHAAMIFKNACPSGISRVYLCLSVWRAASISTTAFATVRPPGCTRVH